VATDRDPYVELPIIESTPPVDCCCDGAVTGCGEFRWASFALINCWSSWAFLICNSECTSTISAIRQIPIGQFDCTTHHQAPHRAHNNAQRSE